MSHAANLPRLNINIDHIRNELLNDAGKLLGYKLANEDSFLYKLAALEIIPFRTSAVEAYQKSKAVPGMYSGTRNWIIIMTAVACTLAGGIYGAGIAKSGGTVQAAMVFTIIISAVLFVIFGLVGGVAKAMIGRGTRTKRIWCEVPLSAYDGYIPDHVLNKAVEIKKKIPGTQMHVAYLDNTVEHAPDPDPFLRVQYGVDRYFVEQWDERDFPRIQVS